MHKLALGLVVSLAGVVEAQNPRPSLRIDGASFLSFDPVVASRDNLSLAAWWVQGGGVFVARSDGTAKTWSSGIRVDADALGAPKDILDGDVRITASSAYIVWRDERQSPTNAEVYFSRSTDGGATWSAEQWIDKTLPPGFGTVRDWRLAVEEGAPDRVHILLSVDPSGFANEVLILVRSLDGGATFLPAVVVPQGVLAGAFDVDNCELSAEGGALYVTWVDNRNGEDDVFFQKSTDSGATWLAVDRKLDSSVGGNAEGTPELVVRGSVVAVIWLEEKPNNAPDSLWANVSTDGGSTFNGDRLVGNYLFNVVDVDNHELAITSTGNVIAAWDDNRNGIDDTFVAMSSDGGITWQQDVKLSTNGGEFPRIATNAWGEAVVQWTGGVFPEFTRAVLSRDGGATWEPEVIVSDNTGDADAAEGTFNDLYGNFVSIYLADDLGANHVYVGGFRPQTATNMGWGSSSPTMHFDVSGFGTDTVAIVGLSVGTTPFPVLGGPRVWCLSPTQLLVSTLTSPLFLAPLSGGSGSTPTIPNPWASVTVGLTLHYGALGIDTSGGIGRLTDPLSFTL